MPMSDAPDAVVLALPYRRPFAFDHLLRFHAARAVPGVEHVDEAAYTRVLALPRGPAVAVVSDDDGAVSLELRHAHPDHVAAAAGLVRRMFDLDADPQAVDAALRQDPAAARSVTRFPGLRVPGSPDPHESLFRAIVGQQITVARATALLADMAARMPSLGFDGPVNRLFPTAERMAEGLHALYRGPAARREALRGAAEALVEDPDLLERTRDPEALSDTLVGLRGVGPWTAAYVSMRVLNAPDVPLPGDAAVATGARLLGVDDAAAAYERVRPFRSSFTIHAWNAAAGG